jgi:periplasmic protein TonB
VCAKSCKSDNGIAAKSDSASLRACLVDGDAAQLNGARCTRRRSVLLSLLVQIGILAAVVLIPLLSKAPRIALANVMPLPPYYHAKNSEPATQRPHPATRPHEFTFCLTCPPVLNKAPTVQTNSVQEDDISIGPAPIGDGGVPPCPDCVGLVENTRPRPAIPEIPTPSIVRVTHLDPAMLIRRVEPVYPTLPRQTGREGRVELRAIIGTDGTVRSLQFLDGDAMFYQSTLDAVRQWRYKPTVLNGRAVEVDTHITVIYKLNR